VAHFYAVLEYVRTERAKLADMEAKARDEIQNAMGDNEIGTIEGREVVRWCRTTRRAVDVTYLKQAYPDIASACTRTTEIRAFRLVVPE